MVGRVDPMFKNPCVDRRYIKGLNSESNMSWEEIKKHVLMAIEVAYLCEKNVDFKDLDKKTIETIGIIYTWVEAFFEDGLALGLFSDSHKCWYRNEEEKDG